jgi:hypothetical protein
MKRRYNHETKQWDIVLSPYDYGRLMQELEMLRQQVSRQIQAPRPLMPYEVPKPNFVPGYPPEWQVTNLSATRDGISMAYNDSRY